MTFETFFVAKICRFHVLFSILFDECQLIKHSGQNLFVLVCRQNGSLWVLGGFLIDQSHSCYSLHKPDARDALNIDTTKGYICTSLLCGINDLFKIP